MLISIFHWIAQSIALPNNNSQCFIEAMRCTNYDDTTLKYYYYFVCIYVSDAERDYKFTK